MKKEYFAYSLVALIIAFPVIQKIFKFEIMSEHDHDVILIGVSISLTIIVYSLKKRLKKFENFKG